MSAGKVFGLGDVLSVTTGILVSRRHVDGVYDVLQHMVGGPVWTHQLPRVSDEVTPDILRQHPWLGDITVPIFPDGDEDTVRTAVFAWLDGIEAVHGSLVSLHPLSDPADHTPIHPVDELQMMRPDVVIIPVTIPEDE